MGRSFYARLAAIAGIAIFSMPAWPHHGASAYDQSRTVTFDATITEFDMVNPHASLLFDTKDANGNLIHWACEMNSPSWLLREGWTRDTLKPGDHIKVVAHPNKKEDVRVIFLMKAIFSDGRELLNGPPQ